MISFIELFADDRAAFGRVCEVYQQVIPAIERKTILQLDVMLSRRDYRFIAGRDEKGTIIAFAVMFVGSEVRLLEYLGVEANHQKRGIGAAVFQYCAAIGEGPMVIEVEREDVAGVDQLIRERRVEFYRRAGCLRVEGLEYQLPLSRESPPMRLFVHGVGDQETIRQEEVRRFLTTLYIDVYGQTADDPRIAEMMDGLPEVVALR